MSNDTYSFGQRIFRALFTALVGGAVGLLLALVLIRSGWIRNWNPITEVWLNPTAGVIDVPAGHSQTG